MEMKDRCEIRVGDNGRKASQVVLLRTWITPLLKHKLDVLPRCRTLMTYIIAVKDAGLEGIVTVGLEPKPSQKPTRPCNINIG